MEPASPTPDSPPDPTRAGMVLVRHHLHDVDPGLPVILVPVDRRTLARRRWRGTAQDGTDFGFDLDHALAHRDAVHITRTAVYRIDQTEEPVLIVDLGSAPAAARTGWLIGNLHFPAQVDGSALVVAEDPALRQMFAREGIPAREARRRFHPMGGGHSHGHDHTH